MAERVRNRVELTMKSSLRRKSANLRNGFVSSNTAEVERCKVPQARSLQAVAVAVAFLIGSMATASAADLSKAEVTAALHTIKKTADGIAAGRYMSKDQLRKPARIIAIEWAKAEPVLIHRGYAIVETRFANRSIAAFERDWKRPTKARAAAHDVSSNIASLMSTRREYGKSTVSPPPSITP